MLEQLPAASSRGPIDRLLDTIISSVLSPYVWLLIIAASVAAMFWMLRPDDPVEKTRTPPD